MEELQNIILQLQTAYEQVAADWQSNDHQIWSETDNKAVFLRCDENPRDAQNVNFVLTVYRNMPLIIAALKAYQAFVDDERLCCVYLGQAGVASLFDVPQAVPTELVNEIERFMSDSLWNEQAQDTLEAAEEEFAHKLAPYACDGDDESAPCDRRDWLPVLILSDPLLAVPGQLPKPFTVTRVYLADSPDGILLVGWDVPIHDRHYPKAQLVGWKPERDVPFDLPVKFYRKGDSRVSTLIPRGAWVLPYDEQTYWRYQTLAHKLAQLYQDIANNTLDFTPDDNGRFYF